MRPVVAWAIGALVFLALLVAAIAWDGARGLQRAYRLVLDNDREVRLQEDRLLANLASVGIKVADLQPAIAQFRQAQAFSEREAAFQGIVAGIGQLRPTAPDDPIARRAADEFAGAANRRQIALRRYVQAVAQYNVYSQGVMGSLGRRVSDLPERLDER
jgi:hypothetical protein